jgi:hypothetical protein
MRDSLRVVRDTKDEACEVRDDYEVTLLSSHEAYKKSQVVADTI